MFQIFWIMLLHPATCYSDNGQLLRNSDGICPYKHL